MLKKHFKPDLQPYCTHTKKGTNSACASKMPAHRISNTRININDYSWKLPGEKSLHLLSVTWEIERLITSDLRQWGVLHLTFSLVTKNIIKEKVFSIWRI